MVVERRLRTERVRAREASCLSGTQQAGRAAQGGRVAPRAEAWEWHGQHTTRSAHDASSVAPASSGSMTMMSGTTDPVLVTPGATDSHQNSTIPPHSAAAHTLATATSIRGRIMRHLGLSMRRRACSTVESRLEQLQQLLSTTPAPGPSSESEPACLGLTACLGLLWRLLGLSAWAVDAAMIARPGGGCLPGCLVAGLTTITGGARLPADTITGGARLPADTVTERPAAPVAAALAVVEVASSLGWTAASWWAGASPSEREIDSLCGCMVPGGL